MELSIIIAHYDPGNSRESSSALKTTLETIHRQKDDFDVEVIIADDGSSPNVTVKDLATQSITSDNRVIHLLQGDRLSKWLLTTAYSYPEVSYWLYLPKDKHCMCKARLANVALSLAKSENILILDDDNVFITQDSIRRLLALFDRYDLVIGQIKDKNGHLRPYSSHRVQGTTIGVKKSILEQIGGFGEWTESISSGVDADLWWKLFHYFKEHPESRACYTSSVRTLDTCSKRWKPFVNHFFRHRAVAREFNKKYECRNYRSATLNQSRDKTLWIEDLARKL